MVLRVPRCYDIDDMIQLEAVWLLLAKIKVRFNTNTENVYARCKYNHNRQAVVLQEESQL